MYSNFEFLREVNSDLYEIGKSIERQVYSAPSAVLAEATTFLDNILISISDNDNILIDERDPFWQNCDKLFQANVISESFKKILIKTFDIRNHMHGRIKSAQNYLNGNKNRAIAMVKSLFKCAWNYYQYLGNKDSMPNFIEVKDLNNEIINVESCIICGDETDSNSFFCKKCNENINHLNIVEHFCEEYGYEKLFSELHIGPLGYTKEYSDEFLPKLVSKGLLYEVNNKLLINKEALHNLRSEVGEYKKIENLFKQYYYNELTISELKQNATYIKDSMSEELFNNFYNFLKIESKKLFLKECQTDKILKEINRSNLVSEEEIEKMVLVDEVPILISKLKEEFVSYKKSNIPSEIIKEDLLISDDLYIFLENETKEELYEVYVKDQFYNDLMNGKFYKEALKINDVTTDELNRFIDSDKDFERKLENVIEKRKNILVKSLEIMGFEAALKKASLEQEDLSLMFNQDIINDIHIILKEKYLKLIKDFKTSKEAMELCEIDSSIFDEEFLEQIWNIKSYNLLQLLLKGVKLNKALDKVEISFKDFEEKLLSKDEFNKIIRDGESIFANEQIKISFRNLKGLNKSNDEIKNILALDNSNYDLLGGLLADDLIQIKKNRYLSSLRCGNTYDNALSNNNITEEEISKFKNSDSEFKKALIEIRENRKDILLNSLENNGLKTAIKESKLTQEQLDILFKSKNSDDFYSKVNKKLRENFLKLINSKVSKEEALELCEVGEDIFEKWMGNPDFKNKMAEINFKVLIDLLNNGKSLEDALKHCNTSRKEFDKYVLDAFNGASEYGELLDIYFDKIYSIQFSNFLKELSDNTTKTALKNVGLDERIFLEDIKSNKNHHDVYLKTKKCKYIRKSIREGHLAALKYSEMSHEEFNQNKEEIMERSNQMKKDLLIAYMVKYNKNPFQAVKKIDLELEDVYDAYLNGIYNGKDSEFARSFELAFIKPTADKVVKLIKDKKISVNRALTIIKNESEGAKLKDVVVNKPKSRLSNRNKALLRAHKTKNQHSKGFNMDLSLSNEDYKLWKKYNIFESYMYHSIDIKNINMPDMAYC